MIINIENPSIVEVGSYTARFDDLELVNGAKHGDFYRFNFTIIEGPCKDRRVNGVCSTILRQGTKLYNWIAGISGETLVSGEQIDTSKLIGKICKVIIEHRQRGDRTYANISKIIKCITGNADDNEGNVSF